MTDSRIIDETADSSVFEDAGANSLASQTGAALGGTASDDDFVSFDTLDLQASGDGTIGGDATTGATSLSTGTTIAGGTAAVADSPSESAATSEPLLQAGASADAGANMFDWAVASGDFGAASSWGLGEPGGVSGPPTAADYAYIKINANIFGGGVATNLDIDAAVTISSPLNTTVAGVRTTVGAAATGSVTVSSTWNAVGQLQVGGFPIDGGEAPAGTLTIDAGGVVDNSDAIGANIGVYNGGAGTLIVQGGGQFFDTQANYLTLAVNPGSVGIMTISGAGSTVNIAGGITVCYQGVGDVTVENGGSLFTNGVTQNGYYDLVGNQAGSVGTMTVTGANSVWKSANSVNVGEETFLGGCGVGTMSATLGGFIQSAQGLSVWTGSTISVDAYSVIESGPTGGAKPGYLTLDADDGFLYGDGTVDGNVIDNNAINAIAGGAMTINGAITGDGAMDIGLDGDLVLNSSVTATGGVDFYSWYGTLALFDPLQFSGPIRNFMPGDTIDLTNTPYDAADSSVSFSSGVNGAPNQLVVTEGADTYDLDVYSIDPLSGTLTLKKDASGTGTDIVFDSTPASPFNLWSSLPNFYRITSGQVNGEDWGTSNATDGGNPLWVDTETPAAGYAPGVAGDYSIVMTTQDWLGGEQPLVAVATDYDFVDPFGDKASAIGDLAAAVTFGSNDTTGEGAVLYWQASATPGDYALVLQPTTTTYMTAPSAGPSTTPTGSPVTLAAAVGDPTSWTDNTGTPTTLVVAYTTAVMPTTEDLWFQAFTNTGVATTQAVEVQANIPDSTQYYISYNSSSGAYGYAYSKVDGGDTGLYGGTFNPNTGALGAAGELISAPSFTSITGLAVHANLSSNNSLLFLEGVDNGQAVIQAFASTSSTPTATFDLSSADDHFATAAVFDPNDDQLDFTVLAYADNNQVHLELLDENGVRVGSDLIVPGLTSFDQIHTLTGQNLSGYYLDADTRVEIDYTVADPNGGKEIKGLIYDTSGSPDYYTLGQASSPFFYASNGSSDNEYDGTPFDDTVLYAPGVYTVDGGGGTDTFVDTGFTASQLSISVDAQGDVVLSDGKGDVDTLKRFSTILLSRASIGIYGDTLVQTSSDDGSKIVSTFDIGGNPAASSVLTYSPSLTLTSETLNGVAEAVSGSGVPLYLNSAQAAVTGGGDTIYFSNGSGNAVGLYSTGSNWDAVEGSGSVIALTHAFTEVTGGGDAVYMEGGSGNAVAISNTGANWDLVNGSGSLVEMTNAFVEVTGGGDAIDFEGVSGNVVALYSTAGAWDGVTGSNGEVVLTNAFAELFGGGNAVYMEGGSGDALAIYNSGGDWDNVDGSGALVVLTKAYAEVTGGGNSIYLEGVSGNAAALYDTGGVYDTVNGSNSEIILTSAEAEVTGGGNSIFLEGGSGNTAALYDTGGKADGVNGSNGTVVLTNAEASVNGAGDSIYLSGNSSVTANGASEAFVFQRAIGEEVVGGFASTDTMQFSAADFANWSALQSHTSQSGANTVIALDASETVTLTGVTATNLVASQFHFV